MDNQNYDLNYSANYNPVPQQEFSKKPAITAMILGIIASSLCWFPIVGIAGIILGIIGRVKVVKERRRNVPQTHGFLLSGGICSMVGIIAGAIMLVYWIVLFAVGLG